MNEQRSDTAELIDATSTSYKPPAFASPSSTSADIGRLLSERRRALSLGLDDIVARLKRPPRQIEALEAGQWDMLPQGGNLHGFVRTYAQVLALDAEPLLERMRNDAAYADELAISSAVAAPLPQAARPASPRAFFIVVAVLLAVAALFVVVIADRAPSLAWLRKPSTNDAVTAAKPAEASSGSSVSTTPIELGKAASTSAPASVSDTGNSALDTGAVVASPSSASFGGVPAASSANTASSATPTATHVTSTGVSSTPTASAPASVSDASNDAIASAPSSGALRLKFESDSWFEVKRANGQVVASGLGKAGTDRNVDASGAVIVVLGNARAVNVEARGKRVDLAPVTRGDGVARFEVGL